MECISRIGTTTERWPGVATEILAEAKAWPRGWAVRMNLRDIQKVEWAGLSYQGDHSLSPACATKQMVRSILLDAGQVSASEEAHRQIQAHADQRHGPRHCRR